MKNMRFKGNPDPHPRPEIKPDCVGPGEVWTPLRQPAGVPPDQLRRFGLSDSGAGEVAEQPEGGRPDLECGYSQNTSAPHARADGGCGRRVGAGTRLLGLSSCTLASVALDREQQTAAAMPHMSQAHTETNKMVPGKACRARGH